MRISVGWRACILFASGAIQPAEAAESHCDFQFWPTFRVLAVTDRFEITGDTVLQFADQSSRLSQYLIRGVAAYRFTDELSAGGGYTYTATAGSSAVWRTEHRIVQDFNYRPILAELPFTITARIRMEERFRESAAPTAFRLRQFTRIDLPLAGLGIGTVLWNETFYALNDTAWSGPAGATLTLNFAGLRIPVSSRLSVEPGYLNYASFKGEKMRHIFGIYFNVRL